MLVLPVNKGPSIGRLSCRSSMSQGESWVKKSLVTDGIWLADGRGAIEVVVSALKDEIGRAPEVAVTEMVCKEVPEAIIRGGGKVSLYTRREIEDHIGRFDLIIVVSLMGTSIAREARKIRQSHECLVMGDLSHRCDRDLKSFHDCDIVFTSVWKHLPIPDGSVLAFPRGENRLTMNIRSRIKATKMRRGFSSSCLWLLKRALQKVGCRCKVRKVYASAESSSGSKEIRKPSLITCGLLRTCSGQISKHRLMKRECADGLRKLLRGVKLEVEAESYMYMAKVSIKADSDLWILRLLEESGLPVIEWPGIDKSSWDLERQTRVEKFKEQNKYIAMNASVSHRALQRCRERLRKLLTDSLVVSTDKEYDWTDKESPRYYPMTQLRCYAKSKGRRAKGLRIESQGGNIWFCLVEERRFLFLTIMVLNRGPVLVRRGYDGHLYDSKMVIEKIKEEIKGWNCIGLAYFCSIVGEAPDRRSRKWQEEVYSDTEIVDLTKDIEELRMRLKGKWRNQLKRAEMNSLQVKTHWELGKIKEACQANIVYAGRRGFDPPSKEFVLGLAKEIKGEGGRVGVIEVIKGEELMCRMIVVIGKGTITNLAHITSDRGRKCYAGNLAMWQAIVIGKELGLKSFDVGGLSQETKDGITRFKKGLCGKEVTYLKGWCVL